MGGRMDCYGATDIGLQRETNEDQFLISDISKSMRVHQTSLALSHQTRLLGDTQGKLLLVADGMGGHEAGERASQLVVDGVVDYILNRLHWFMFGACSTDESFEEDLKKALVDCQSRIEREVAAIPSRRGMGSTLTMGYIAWPRLFIVHVGDCRCYLLRNGELKLMTRDHTLANGLLNTDLADNDRTDEEVTNAPFSNVLWNTIGGDPRRPPRPDAMAIDLQMGDTILLCSDGLNKHLSRAQIEELLNSKANSEQLCTRLISAAKDAGGSDNVTVIVSRFNDQESAEMERATAEQVVALSDTADFDNPPVQTSTAIPP